MLLFGSEFLPSGNILMVLTSATFIQAILGAAGPTLSMTGHTRLVLWNTVAAFVMNFFLNWFLIPAYGIMGAAVATLISLTTIGLVRVIQVQVILKLNFLDRRIIKPLFAGAVVATVMIYMKEFIMPFHTLVTLLIAGLLSFSIFSLVMWGLKIEAEDKEFFQGIKTLTGSFTKK